MNGICHVEIPSRNLGESAGFYSKAFGWECKEHGECYAFFKTPEGLCGGFDLSGTPNSDFGLILYIETEDIPGLLARIEELGGKTVKEKSEIGDNMGFYAIFLDPHGNRFGLYSEK